MKKLITFFIILLTVIHISGPVEDPDLWWHIIVGRWILHHGFCHTDEWNLYSDGVFRAYSWFPEIVFSLIDKFIGVLGFLYLKIILGFIIGFILVSIFQKISKDNVLGVILGAMTLLSFSEFFTLRPQMISWICFPIVIFIANKIYDEGWNKKRYIEVFLIFSLWTNSHLSQILGMLAFFMWGFNGFNRNTYKLFLVPFLGTLLNPYFLSVWFTFLTKVDHPFVYNDIIEFVPLSVLSTVFGAFVVLFFFFALVWHFYSDALNKTRIFLLMIFIVAGIFITKMMPYTMMLLSFYTCFLWSKDAGRKVLNMNEALERFKKMLGFFEGTGTAFLLLCLVIVNVNSLIKKEYRKDSKIYLPIQATKFIKENHLKFPVLNDFTSGGYLIYSFSNEKGEALEKFPIDGRTNVNSKKVYRMYEKAFAAKKGWRNYIKYVKPNTILWPNRSPLVQILNLDKENWCRVFSDKYIKGYTVFIKRGLNDKLCLN